MTTVDLITEIFCQVDDVLRTVRKHPQAQLWPSEVVTLGMVHALKGGGSRAFYRWLVRDYRNLFPRLPERTRLFRLLKTHRAWTRNFLAKPSLLGVVDSYGIELLHPVREGRSPQQIGRKGLSNHRWMVGGKLCVVLNHLGGIAGWVWAPANAHDTWFQPLIEQFQNHSVIFGDTGFHAESGDPPNLKICQRGEWNDRMVVETVLSMLTVVAHFKKVMHRKAPYFEARLAFTVAVFNLLVAFNGWQPDTEGFVPLHIAEFSL